MLAEVQLCSSLTFPDHSESIIPGPAIGMALGAVCRLTQTQNPM